MICLPSVVQRRAHSALSTGNSFAASAYTRSNSVNNCAANLCSQGFWGAVITMGGNQENGDAYSPANNGSYSPSNNVKYDQNGYFYTVEFTSGGGSIYVYDPTFCAMGANNTASSGSYGGGAGNFGTSDHWIAGSNNPVSTYYTVWNTNGQPYFTGNTEVYYSNTLFEAKTQSDQSNGGATGMTVRGVR